jgi:hypothetical protein
MRDRPVKPTVIKNKGASQALKKGRIMPDLPRAMLNEEKQ